MKDTDKENDSEIVWRQTDKESEADCHKERDQIERKTGRTTIR